MRCLHLQTSQNNDKRHNFFKTLIRSFFTPLRFTSSPQRNRSLYDELSADISYPTFSSPFSSSSVEQVSSEPSEEENKSLEGSNNINSNSNNPSSLERAFKADENDFKNNATKEERHRLEEIKFDEESIIYSSSVNLTTSTQPPPAVATKKGKYLDLIPLNDDDNINASLPNAAEVWALAGMRDMDGNRKGTDTTTESIEDNSDVELLSLNNTVKSLLDWTEIARLDNETDSITPSTSQTTNDINNDPATAENKEIAVSSVLPPSTTAKSTSSTSSASTTTTRIKNVIEDNRLELEHENAEFTAAANKSVIDDEIFNNKNRDESSSIELIAPLGKKKSNKLEIEISTTIEPILTTTDETIITTASDVTTSIIDSFTDKSSDENSEVYKRTITELPETFSFSTTTQSPRTSTFTTITDEVSTTQATFFTSTQPPLNTNINARSTMVTKSISIRIATTTTEPIIEDETTLSNEDTTTAQYDNIVESSVSTIEIMDEDKFKYSTVLPESTQSSSTIVSPTVYRSVDSTRSDVSKEGGVASTADEGDGSNVAIISICISIVVFLLLVAGGFVS